MSNASDCAPHFQFTDADLFLDCNVFCDDELNEWSKEHNEDKTKAVVFRIPKIPKNDIRRYFSSMFMNTCNSGDFHHIQRFSHTFMINKCNCISKQKLPLALKIPDLVTAEGPLLFSHYLLGLQIMCPDVTIQLINSKIITYSNSSVTKIVMDVKCSMTKVAHIPYELWIPPPDMLTGLYRCNSLHDVCRRYTNGTNTSNNTTTKSTSISNCANSTISGTSNSTTTNHTNTNSSSNNFNTNTNSTSNNIDKEDNTRKRKTHSDMKENDMKSVKSTDRTSNNSHSTGSSDSTSNNNSKTTAVSTGTYIPESYMYKLMEVASLLPSPQRLDAHAQLVIIMDQHKHIIAINFHIDPF